jgi:hypothetical protein
VSDQAARLDFSIFHYFFYLSGLPDMDSENLIYWKDRPVGIEAGGRILWFSDAPREAIEALS